MEIFEECSLQTEKVLQNYFLTNNFILYQGKRIIGSNKTVKKPD